MLNFKTVGKLSEDDATVIRVFDEPFDTEKGTLIIINSINFVGETDEVEVDYKSEFSDTAAIERWLSQFVQEAIEDAITRAEELSSDQDTQTNQTL